MSDARHETSAEALAAESGLKYVAHLFGPGYRLRRIVYEVEGPDGILERVTIDLARYSLRGWERPREEERPGRFSLRDEIVEVMRRAERPLKGETIARRVGHRYDSYFRELLGKMRRSDGPLMRPPGGGYWLKERPLPESGAG